MLVLAVVVLFGVLSFAAARAEEPGESDVAGVELVSVSVEPSTVRADTLCKLSVELANRGSRTADAFAFDVVVAGQELVVYDSQLFLDPIPAGATRRLQLFNFWSNEEGRALPAEGDLTVEVKLREALWVRVEEDEAEGAQVWTPEGPVGGLPLSKSVSLDVER